jgi:GTP cyclohydrolase II
MSVLLSFFRRLRLSRLYRHIPSIVRKDVLLRTPRFDRIGPIHIPSKTHTEIVDVILYYFISCSTGAQYYLITRKSDLCFNNPLVRISSNCLFAFVANSQRCDCQWQFNRAIEYLKDEDDDDGFLIFAIDDHGKGIAGGVRGHALLYALGQRLKQELISDAYSKNGFTEESRNYDDIHAILASFKIRQLRLLSNNPDRLTYFESMGYTVNRVPLEKPYDKYLSEELGMKKVKLGHKLDLDGFLPTDIEIYGLSKDSFKQ